MSPELVLLLEHLAESPVTVVDISKWTRSPVLFHVLQFIQQGWPSKCDSSMTLTFHAKLNCQLDGCVLCGCRVLVPPPGQQIVLQELHSAHPGMSKMKSLARMYVCMVATLGE